MAKLKPSTKSRITKLFKSDKELPEIRKILKSEGVDVAIAQIKTVLRKYLMKHCDHLWSHAVKLKAGNICIIDRKPCSLNSHHLRGRSNYKFRWDIDNGVCLGVYRHTMASDMAAHGSTSATEAFAEKMEEIRPEQWARFQKNREDHEKIKVDVYYLLETAKRLEAEIKEIENNPKVDILRRRKVEMVPQERTDE